MPNLNTYRPQTLSLTGNITGANLVAGTDGTGTVRAGNIIVNGQPTTYGVASPEYINMTTSAAVNVAASGTDLTWDVNNGSSGIAYSAGKFSLRAGKTYHILAEIAMQQFSANGYLLVELVDGTTNALIGSQTLSIPYNTGFNEVNNPTLDIVHTPVANQDVKLRVTGGTSGLTAQLRGGGFARMSIVQLNSTIAVQATATGTLNSTIGNVTLSNSYSQVVAASIPGTVIFTLPTLQPGTYLITARAKANGGYSAMGIFTGGSQVANTSAFSWYQASGSVNNGLNGTWVLTVTTPTVYTINVWGGGTVSAGSDGSAVANYIQLNPTFALNTLDTMTTTGNVSVGGNLTVTGNITSPNLTGKTTGSWTVATGTNTYSITVPINGNYQIWVRANIPNGIIAYQATVSVTNTNVPVLGTQRAWNYTGGGSPILLTTMPPQIVGTDGTISTAVVSTTTANRFDFVISNTSGSSQTVSWGYVTIS